MEDNPEASASFYSRQEQLFAEELAKEPLSMDILLRQLTYLLSLSRLTSLHPLIFTLTCTLTLSSFKHTLTFILILAHPPPLNFLSPFLTLSLILSPIPLSKPHFVACTG